MELTILERIIQNGFATTRDEAITVMVQLISDVRDVTMKEGNLAEIEKVMGLLDLGPEYIKEVLPYV